MCEVISESGDFNIFGPPDGCTIGHQQKRLVFESEPRTVCREVARNDFSDAVIEELIGVCRYRDFANSCPKITYKIIPLALFLYRFYVC